MDISKLSRIKPFKCKNRFLSEKLCIDEPIFGVLGSNSIELLWFKGGWFPLFLKLRGKWCLLIFGGFPKLNYLYQRNMLIFYKCLMCTLTIRFIKNLWEPKFI